MIKLNALRKNYVFPLVIGNAGKFPWLIFLFLLLISLLPYLGAVFDRSFFLPDGALGIFKHYGNICFTIIFPLIFVFCIQGIHNFDQFIVNIHANLIKEKFEKKEKIDEFLQTNLTKEPYIFLKFLLIFCGFIFATINAINTLEPVKVWNHDVYDSFRHVGGYISQRIFFYIWWAYILPVLIYRLFVIIIILNRVFRLVIDTDSLNLQPMHPDNAGGLGKLGRMALNFNIAILLTMAISAALYYTHGYNLPLVYGMIVQFLLLPIVFFLPLLRAHKAMKLKKESLLLEISKHYKRVSDTLIQKIVKDDISSVNKYDTIKEEYKEEYQLRELYKSLENIPTWPFDLRTIAQFTSTFLLPAVIWLIDGLKVFLRNT